MLAARRAVICDPARNINILRKRDGHKLAGPAGQELFLLHCATPFKHGKRIGFRPPKPAVALHLSLDVRRRTGVMPPERKRRCRSSIFPPRLGISTI